MHDTHNRMLARHRSEQPRQRHPIPNITSLDPHLSTQPLKLSPQPPNTLSPTTTTTNQQQPTNTTTSQMPRNKRPQTPSTTSNKDRPRRIGRLRHTQHDLAHMP